MKRFALLALLPLAFACETPADEPASAETEALRVDGRIVRNPFARRLPSADFHAALARPVTSPGFFTGQPAEQACLDVCGAEPWCDALCAPADAQAEGPAFGASERLPEECPACGRETGFAPRPPAVAVRVEGLTVVVEWSAVTGAEAYELYVLRGKADGGFERLTDLTVHETEVRLSMLAAGHTYVFVVTPYLEGELDVELMGTSEPLSL
jgi:hypothetical protein